MRPEDTEMASGEMTAAETPRTDNADDITMRMSTRHLRTLELARQLERELTEVKAKLGEAEKDYQKIIKEVLACDPIPACERADDQLEPPWEVIKRVRTALAAAELNDRRFQYLQNLPVVKAQAYFWMHQSRKQRAKAIDEDMAALGGDHE